MIILITVCLFVGCSEKPQKITESALVSNQAVTLSIDDVQFIDSNGEAVYCVVRPSDNNEIMPYAQQVVKYYKSLLSVNVKNVLDGEDGTDRYEILIGDCNREEVEVARKYLEQKTGGRYDDYIICTVGKKLVIYSQSTESLSDATKYFVDNFLKKDGIKGGIEYVCAVEGDFKTLTVNGVPIGRFSLIRQHYNASYLTELEMNKMVDRMYSETGYRLEIEHDQYTEPSEYEIIVGNANRDGVETITDYDEYRIKIAGKKIYLNGGSPHATAMAVSEFEKMLDGDITDAQSKIGSYADILRSYDMTTTLYKTWGEDFDGTEIDTVKWRVGDKSMYTPGLNDRIQVRSEDPDDVFVKDGKFYICARDDGEFYYGGIIQTYETYKYGYVEMSSVIPHGKGFWTALYMCTEDKYSATDPNLPQLAGPEYDVMECFGNSEHFAANIHSWPKEGAKLYEWEHISLDNTHGNEKRYHSVDKGVVLGQNFHTYGMMWDDTRVTFTCDADPYFTYDTTTNLQDIETNNHSVWLRIAMNVGSSTNPEPGITDNLDDWHKTNKFIIDWIHVYQKNDGKCMLNGVVLE